ncbi:MAG: MarR family transcriptional regulator [Gilvibacter sp.]
MELSTKTVINLMYTCRVIEERILGVLKPYGLSIQQYNVLRILRGQKSNPCSVSKLQSRMIDRNSNTTRLIDKLLSKGLVKRQVCEQNRRKVELFITTEGLDVLEQLDPLILENNQNLISQLDKSQLDSLNIYLNTIRN